MSDQFLRLQHTDDGQADWSEWDQESIGEIGEYGKRIVFTRMGMCRQRVYRIRITSPRKCDLLACVATIVSTDG